MIFIDRIKCLFGYHKTYFDYDFMEGRVLLSVCSSCDKRWIESKLMLERVSNKFVRCPRCRKYHIFDMNFDSLCDRCCEVLLELNEDIEGLEETKAGIIEGKLKQREIYALVK